MTARAGFFGKIPARGDFVRAGLAPAPIAAWDGWMSGVLLSSKARLGEGWLAAWLEAPVWRFAFPAATCGPDAMLGLWLPSVDAIGRHYPLMLAATAPGGDPARLEGDGAAWLDAAEAAGLAALEATLDPDAIAGRLPPPPAFGRDAPPDASARWWTDGSPRVPPRRLDLDGLPGPALFAAMLDATAERT